MSVKKLMYCGARLMDGVSGKTGNPYLMVNFFYLVPAEVNMGKLMTRHEACGYEVKEKAIPVSVFEDIQKADIKPLSWVEVEIDIDPENDDRTIFTKVKATASPVAEIPTKKAASS